MQSHPWRVPLAFLLAPLVPCALYALILGTLAQRWAGLFALVIAMVITAEALTLVLAVPAYLLIKRLWRVGLLECVLAGAGVALVFGSLDLVLPLSSGYSAGDSGGPTVIDGRFTVHGYVSWAIRTMVNGLLGGSIGLTFWVLAFFRKDRGAQ